MYICCMVKSTCSCRFQLLLLTTMFYKTSVVSIIGENATLNWCSPDFGAPSRIRVALSMFNHSSIFHYRNFVCIPVYCIPFSKRLDPQKKIILHWKKNFPDHPGKKIFYHQKKIIPQSKRGRGFHLGPWKKINHRRRLHASCPCHAFGAHLSGRGTWWASDVLGTLSASHCGPPCVWHSRR